MSKMRFLIVFLVLSVLLVGGAWAQADPAITIGSPLEGDYLPAQGFLDISGTGTALPEGSVIVNILDVDDNILAEAAATTDAADPVGTGSWSVRIDLTRSTIADGTPAMIRAFSLSPADGSLVAEAMIDVIFGPPPTEVQPTAVPPTALPPTQVPSTEVPVVSAVVVFTPAMNAVVTHDGTVTATGSATNVPEGNVVVRALDVAGNVLAEQAVVASGAVGGTGSWQADLTVQVERGTLGSIYAFSPSPADGSVIADGSVPVTFGTLTTSEVAITLPPANGVLNTSEGVTVTGTSRDVFEGNVIVVIRDAAENVLASRATTSSAAVGEGIWETTLRFYTTEDMSGSVLAYSTSPVDGSVDVSAVVPVTFQKNCTINEDWQAYTVVAGDTLAKIAQLTDSTVAALAEGNCLNNVNLIQVGQALRVPTVPPDAPLVRIETPAELGVVPRNVPVTVSGVGAGTFENTVVVEVLDTASRTLSVEPTLYTTETLGAEGPWSLDITLEDVPGAVGTVFAYATSPVDGAFVAADVQNVFFGDAVPDVYVTITEPLPFAITPDSQTLTVSGQGNGLFEANVVVEVRDGNGILLVQQPTIVDFTTGVWTIDLPINAAPGTRATVRAYSISPEDGSALGVMTRYVTLGDPSANERFVRIVTPRAAQTFPRGEFLLVTGRAGGLNQNTVTVEMIDFSGAVRVMQPVNVQPDGTFAVNLELARVEPGASLRLVAFGGAPDGSIISDNLLVNIALPPAEE